MNERITRYCDVIRGNLEGWVSGRQPMMLDLIDRVQSEMGVSGDIAEIGVHHGLFLLLLAAARRDTEMVRAFDVFDLQEQNVDHSGCGSREMLEDAIQLYYSLEQDKFVISRIDSLSMRLEGLKSLFPAPVRLFSIDGGHTRVHASNDLAIAQDVIAPGGVAILDDFFAVLWPGVTEGYFQYMANPETALAPVLYFENKLFLTTRSHHDEFITRLRAQLDQTIGEEIHNGQWKYVELSGHLLLCRA